MIPDRMVKWLKYNTGLFLLLLATVCLATALGQAVSGINGSLLMPVALAAALCGWLSGASKMKVWVAAVLLVLPGICGVFIYITGLGVPIENLFSSIYSAISQLISPSTLTQLYDPSTLPAAWSSLGQHLTSVLSRLEVWAGELASGEGAVDPIVSGLVWSLILLLAGFWSGWRLSRNRQALSALAPGAIMLALVLDYTGGSVGLLLAYLALLLILMGVSRFDELRLGWQRSGIDFSDSIPFDMMLGVIPLTILLAGMAAITPSISWQDLVDKLREVDQGGNDALFESLGLENLQEADVYGSTGLIIRQLVGSPPDLSADLVFTVSTGDLAAIPNLSVPIQAQRYYWRTMTYDVYTGAGWISSPVQKFSQPAGSPLMEVPAGYRLVRQQVKVVANRNERVYWTGTLIRANVELEIAWRSLPPFNPSPARDGDMLGTLANSSEYEVISVLPQASIEQLRAAGDDYSAEVSGSTLHLPASVPERVLQLARQLAAEASTPYDRALAIENYLRGFPYSLEVGPPPAGQDVVDYFLFSLQKGFCEYYASAMVVMSRAAGIPARIVYGYSSGWYDPATAQYEVRQENAHAWPELFFPGIGWVEFEPTSSLPEINRVSGNAGSGSETEPGGEHPLMSWLKAHWSSFAASIGGRTLLAALFLMGIFLFWQAGEIWILQLMPASRGIHSLYTRLEKSSRRMLPGLERGLTPHELEEALGQRFKNVIKRWFHPGLESIAGDAGLIVLLYEKQAYSPEAIGRRQVRTGIKAWERLRWSMRLSILGFIKTAINQH